MSNPGVELHALYTDWRARIEAHPGVNSMAAILKPNEDVGIAEIRQAYALLHAIDVVLRRFEYEQKNVNVFRLQLDDWSRVPLSLNAGWTSAVSPDHLIPHYMLQQVESFGHYLEGRVVTLDAGRIDGLSQLVDRANQLLTDADLDPLLKGYLRKLLFEIRLSLDDDEAGRGFDYTEAVQRLWVAFEAAAARSSEDDRPRWKKLADEVLVGFTSNGALEALMTGLRAITGS